MQHLHRHTSTKTPTPQQERAPGRQDQAQNAAGGYGWAVTPRERLLRFLVLGTEGGTYYATERDLTVENTYGLRACLAEDGPGTVELIAQVSEEGRAPKNDPALFALAVATVEGDDATRYAALRALGRVARTGTHLFTFLTYRQAFGGWGRGLRRAVAAWYTGRPADGLAYQMVKYRQRAGWTHRDVLRKAHPRPRPLTMTGRLLAWAATGADPGHPLVGAYLEAQATEDPARLAALVLEHRLPREALPTGALRHAVVWEAMLEAGMPLTALIRNLGVMSARGLFGLGSAHTQRVAGRLTDAEALARARVHPIQILSALVTYASGAGARGSLTWSPSPRIVEALDEAFYLSFGHVAPIGNRVLLGVDVSGSMAYGTVSGVPGLTPRMAAAAMAMVAVRTEAECLTMAFARGFTPLALTRNQRLDDVMRLMEGFPHQSTDCALPMLWATKQGQPIDSFITYTDNETWAGGVHPFQALRAHRERFGHAAKLVTVAMTSGGFSIADPTDPGMMDVVGFDAAAPNVMQGFLAR